MTKLAYERPVITKLNAGTMNKFGTRTEFAPVTQIDGVPVKKLLADYGSPCFVISEKTIRETYRNALRAFKTRYPKVQFAWSYKTNYLNAVCNVFHSEGSWAEVVSIFEYDKALKNGVSGDKIIFNGPDKTENDLRKAVANNSLIHIDHSDELYLLTQILENSEKKARVAIRVNMDTGVYPMWDRFGFNYENGSAWSAINKIFAHPEMELVGLHCHIGTYMLSTNAYSVAAGKLCDLAFGIKQRYGKTLAYLDLGGGFASGNTLKGSYLQGSDVIPSIDDYAEAITSTILNYGFKTEDLPTLFLETGRALIDDAGYLLGSVIAIKRLSDGRRATIMDFGVNLLFTSFWYDHRISPAQEISVQNEDMVVYGPLCMNIDVVRENVNLPLLNRGDNVVVHRVGAYNMTQWMQFIQMRPKVVMIALDGTTFVIRDNETIDTMLRYEHTPSHLQEIKL
ncbi:MAG: diaminopimelate decarboxylase [Thermonemataceae bacterium]|nr:diaminopimelate decarboxylase [Thermonemataceae bacterium]